MLVTVVLFATGILCAYPSVARMQRAHDAELARMQRAHDAVLVRTVEDCDYYRRAAQSCAAAVAHREGQVMMLEALLSQQRKYCHEDSELEER